MNDKYQGTFQRYEIKYLLKNEQYNQLRKALENKFELDQYGKATICNIYFDTPNKECIRTSLEKPIYKEKLRLRSYGIPKAGDTVFVELKKKYKGVVYKRRETMELIHAEHYLYEGEAAKNSSQITKEIDWFLKVHEKVIPAMYISYDRIAMRGIEDPELRITFDSNIRWREEELNLASGTWGAPLLEEGERLMEIKIPGAMPLWLARLLTEFEVYPASFSKYGKGYVQSEESRIKEINEKLNGERKYA